MTKNKTLLKEYVVPIKIELTQEQHADALRQFNYNKTGKYCYPLLDMHTEEYREFLKFQANLYDKREFVAVGLFSDGTLEIIK